MRPMRPKRQAPTRPLAPMRGERLRARCRRVTDVPPASGRAVSRDGIWEGPIDESPPNISAARRGRYR